MAAASWAHFSRKQQIQSARYDTFLLFQVIEYNFRAVKQEKMAEKRIDSLTKLAFYNDQKIEENHWYGLFSVSFFLNFLKEIL